MTKKQFDDLYKYKAVHCDTEVKADEFLALANNFDYKWCSNISLLNHNNWEDNKEKTCYYLGEYGLQFTKIGWYYENGYEVIEYQSKRENDINDIIERINKWATDKKLNVSQPEKQMLKLNEELGELASAMLKSDKTLILDSLGDMLVVIVILHLQMGYTVQQTLNIAWNEIKDRKGKTKNGVFIKENKNEKK
jgi:NTP pyrophosphatase (non-canonical NTP hydrolase)